MEIKTLKNCEQFYVISDVHLRSPTDKKTKILLNFLEKLPQKSHLFLLGDIWDIIFIQKSFFRDHWKPIFDSLYQAKKRGVHTYFLEGNHDFGFQHFSSSFLDERFDVCGDCYFLVKNDEKSILLAHGDDVICPPSYFYFRAFVKSYLVQKLFLALVPGFLCHILFGWYAKLSRKSSHYKKIPQEFFKKCVDVFLKRIGSKKFKIDDFVIGHIHQDREEVIDVGHKVHFYSGPDWDQAPSVLFFDKGKFQRQYLKN